MRIASNSTINTFYHTKYKSFGQKIRVFLFLKNVKSRLCSNINIDFLQILVASHSTLQLINLIVLQMLKNEKFMIF